MTVDVLEGRVDSHVRQVQNLDRVTCRHSRSLTTTAGPLQKSHSHLGDYLSIPGLGTCTIQCSPWIPPSTKPLLSEGAAALY